MSAITNGLNIQNNYDRIAETQKTVVAEDKALPLEAGKTITGTLQGIDGNTARIQVGNAVINARLEGNMNLNPGDKVTFALRSVNNNQITLSPLFTNLNGEEMASKALSNAGLPVNSFNIKLTGEMMDAGLSIDSRSLNDMSRLKTAYPDTSVSSLAEMQRFGLDINSDSIEKFSAFKNYENGISDGMNKIMDGINDAVKSLLNEGNNTDAARLLGQVIKTFSPAVNASGSTDINTLPGQENAKTVTVDGNPLKVMNSTDVQGLGNNGESLIREKVIISEEEISGTAQNLTENVDDLIDSIKNETIKNAENFEVTVKQPGQDIQKYNVDINTKLTDAWQSLNNTDKSAMVDVLKQAGLAENEAKILMSEKATQTDFLNSTESLLGSGSISDSLKDLIMSDKFGGILKSQMQAQWMLTPIDVENKKTVEELYDRLTRQTKELTDTLQALNIPGNELSSNLSDMNDNLNFMEQMNQAMQYVQLPLKMSGGETTGDLYVYTNKKHSKDDNDSVSAFLHLDMANLGPVDVYASITPGNNVYTKFTLASEEMIDFINDNIHILDERLSKRGYSLKTEILSDTKGVKDTADKAPAMAPKDSKLIKKYSFDCLV